MNKSILTVVVFTFVISHTSGQITFGAKAGINFANVYNIGSTDNKTRFGINAGLLGKVNVSKKVFIQLETLYSIKGHKFPKTTLSGAGFLSLNYISIPLLGGFNFTDKFSAFLGPEFNFLTNANSKFDDSNHDVSKNYRKFDFAIDLGVAYNPNNKLGIDLRYSYGFEDLADVTTTDLLGNPIGKERKGSNRVLQLGLYYYIFARK